MDEGDWERMYGKTPTSNNTRTEMTDTEKLTLLLKVLKSYAEEKHCYERTPDYQPYDCADYNYAFEDGCAYGEITFARTMLECIGEKFEYPCMKEDT